jgi:hypothetical protein
VHATRLPLGDGVTVPHDEVEEGVKHQDAVRGARGNILKGLVGLVGLVSLKGLARLVELVGLGGLKGVGGIRLVES